MKNFLITEEEKSRILNMHKSAIAKQYLGEQGTPTPATTTQTTQPTQQPQRQMSNITIDFKPGDNLAGYAAIGQKNLQIVLKPTQDANVFSVQFSGGDFEPTIEDVYYWKNNQQSSKNSLKTFVGQNIQKFVNQGLITQDPISGKQVPVTNLNTNDIVTGIYNKIKTTLG